MRREERQPQHRFVTETSLLLSPAGDVFARLHTQLVHKSSLRCGIAERHTARNACTRAAHGQTGKNAIAGESSRGDRERGRGERERERELQRRQRKIERDIEIARGERIEREDGQRE